MMRTPLLAATRLARIPGLAVALALALALPHEVRAACSDLAVAEDLPTDAGTVGLVQTGLRTALSLGDSRLGDNPLLRDGRLGPTTRAALVTLCATVPLPASADSTEATLALAERYGALAQSYDALDPGAANDEDPKWREDITGAGFADRLRADPASGLMLDTLALAASPATAAAVIAGDATGATCAGLDSGALSADAQAGLVVLSDLDAELFVDAEAVCGVFPAAGAGEDLDTFLSSVAAIGDGVEDILSPDFTDWLGEEAATRLPRLVGSPDAVIALVGEYRTEDRATTEPDFETLYRATPASCDVTRRATTTTFAAFTEDDLQTIVEPVDVAGPLDGLAGQSFDSADALLAEIETALGDSVDRCTLDQIALAVESPRDLGLAYALNPEGAGNLNVLPGFDDTSGAAVAPFIGLSAQRRGALLSSLRGAIYDAAMAAVDAEIEEAADTLANAAEVVLPLADTRPEDVPEFAAPDAPPPLGVTENTDSAVLATIGDEEFRQALIAAQYQPAPNAEVLKGDVRRILAPLAAARVDRIVTRDLRRVSRVIDASWAMTDDLRNAILAAPGVRAAQSVEIDPALAANFPELPGVIYPNARLFESAVAALAPAGAEVPQGVIDAAAVVAQRQAPDPVAPRDASALAIENCGCVLPRDEHGEVYGFVPFWHLALADTDDNGNGDGNGGGDSSAAADEGADDGEGDAAASPAPQQVDFAHLSRVGFYGLEFTVGAPGTDSEGLLQLAHENRWIESRRAFIETAHRYRAEVDLVFTLRGWQDWSPDDIRDVSNRIVSLSGRYDRFDLSSVSELLSALQSLQSPARPDGVTLIFDGYDGSNPPGLPTAKLRSLVSTVALALRDRGQQVNIAFDMTLAETPVSAPIFSDLRQLFLETESEAPLVHRLLVFLERPTTDTKKHLRGRMEEGDFQGAERRDVLRRILPVVPPAGHRLVRQSTREAAGASATQPEFSQFADDLVYFRDNFRGMGFWPALDPAGEETADLIEEMEKVLYAPAVPAVFGPFSDQVAKACTRVCPNRVYFAGFAGLVALATAVLVLRSFFTGRADKVAFKWGFAWIGLAVLALTLAAMAICDPASVVPERSLMLLSAAVIALLLFSGYQRAQNGPPP